MSGEIIQRIADQIDTINRTFATCFKKELIKQNIRAIARLKKDCSNEDDFVIQIATLATLVDDFNKETLRSCLKGARENRDADGLLLLQNFLDENKLDGETIVANFRFIKRVRSTTFPIHRGGGDFLALMREIGYSPPFEWDIISRICANKYLNGLEELYKQIEKLFFDKIQYEKIDARLPRNGWLQRRGFVTYPNDVLYDFRVILEPNYAYKNSQLVDYLTAATIAFARNLKSVNYALRKYVIPVRDKFREHLEDLSFAKKRRYISLVRYSTELKLGMTYQYSYHPMFLESEILKNSKDTSIMLRQR